MEKRDTSTTFSKSITASGELMRLICNKCDVFYTEANIAFQPAGLNWNEWDKLDSYARILIYFSNISEGDGGESTFRNMSVADRQLYSAMQEYEYRKKYGCIHGSVSNLIDYSGAFEWTPIQFFDFQGAYCLYWDFKRPGIGGQTHVRVYDVFSGTKKISFVLSYNTFNATEYINDLNDFWHTVQLSQRFISNNSSNDNMQNKTIHVPVHSVKYTYQKNLFQETDIKNAPHMIFKLSEIDGSDIISLSAFSEIDYASIGLYDDNLIEYFRQKDLYVCNSNKFGQKGTLRQSCQKCKIDGDINALRTEYDSHFDTPYGSFDVTNIVYRYVVDGELQALCFMLDRSNTLSISSREKIFLSGLKILK